MYEDVANMGFKSRFLQQQVDLAQTLSPNLAKLLALFGGDRRLPQNFLNQPLSREKMEEIEQFLNDPALSQATLQFCEHITSNYSFEEVLEGAIKRTVWHHCLADLVKIESEALDEGFQKGFVSHLKQQQPLETELRVTAIPELGRRVREAAQKMKH